MVKVRGMQYHMRLRDLEALVDYLNQYNLMYTHGSMIDLSR